MSNTREVVTLKDMVGKQLAQCQANIVVLETAINGASSPGNTNNLKMGAMQKDLLRFKAQREQLQFEESILG